MCTSSEHWLLWSFTLNYCWVLYTFTLHVCICWQNHFGWIPIQHLNSSTPYQFRVTPVMPEGIAGSRATGHWIKTIPGKPRFLCSTLSVLIRFENIDIHVGIFPLCMSHKNNIIFNHLHDMFHFNWVSSFYSTIREGGKCFSYYKYCIMYILRFILSVFIYLFIFFLKPFLVLTKLYVLALTL